MKDNFLKKQSSYSLKLLFKATLFIWVLFIPMKTSFYPISYVLMVAIFLYYIFVQKHTEQFKNMIKQLKTLIIFFCLILTSMTISNTLSPITTFQSWSTEFNYAFRYFLIFIILLFFYKERFFTKKFLIVCILFSLFIQGVDGLYQTFFHVDLFKNIPGSISLGLTAATFNRNTFGMIMAVGTSICIGILFQYKYNKLKKSEFFFTSLLMILFLFSLIFSYSRSSWIFLVVFGLIFGTWNYKKIKKFHIIIIFISILVIAILFLTNHDLMLRINSLLSGYSSHRFEIWKQAIGLIKDKILFGYGLMTYGKIGIKEYSGVHNSILEIFLFLGLFGFIAYANLLLYIFKKIILDKNSFYLAFLIAFTVITQFDDSIIKGIVTLSILSIYGFFVFSETSIIMKKNHV